MSIRPKFICCCIGAAASFMLQCGPMAFAAAPVGQAPFIIDTHIHLYQVTRPGGVPWPPVGSPLYRDVLPPEYKALAQANGIRASGVIEASPLVEDNQWILDLLGHDSFFPFYAGQLEIGSPDFIANLDRFSADHRFVGIRGYLWSPPEGIDLNNPEQLRDLNELATRGMTLDIVSRGDTNPKAKVLELCTTFPDLKIIIDHLGGAKGPLPVDPVWAQWIGTLAAECPNLYMKFSSFYDVYAPGDVVFPCPTDLALYKPFFDVLMTAFGPDRLIWGSNWPVSDLHGTLADEIRLAEEYLAPFGKVVRDKVMFRNALLFYRRHVPNGY